MLENKIILITGASSGIGAALARVCVDLGATVLLTGRNESALTSLCDELGDAAISMCYDATEADEVKQAFSHIQKHIGRLDGLVNCAGVMHDAPLTMTRLEDLQAQLQINAVATFQHSQLAARLMSRNKQGCIINLCSAVGEQGSAGQSAYAMTKASVSGLTKSLAKELAPLNIRVNGVAPGFIDTPMTAHYEGDKRASVIDSIGLGRVGSAAEVADLIGFLLSDHASYITGQIIAIDGGLSL